MTRPEWDRPHVLVCGTSELSDWRLVYQTLDRLTKKLKDPIIITGGDRSWAWQAGTKVWVGADYFAEQWASSRLKTYMVFHPDRHKHKPPACYHVRNREMVEHAQAVRKAFCIAFHDGSSPGTQSVIDMCRKADIETRIVRY